MGGCDAKLAGQLADSIDGTSSVQVPAMLAYRAANSPGSELIEVAVFFIAERPGLGRAPLRRPRQD